VYRTSVWKLHYRTIADLTLEIPNSLGALAMQICIDFAALLMIPTGHGSPQKARPETARTCA
jgi:hypothetical protein